MKLTLLPLQRSAAGHWSRILEVGKHHVMIMIDKFVSLSERFFLETAVLALPHCNAMNTTNGCLFTRHEPSVMWTSVIQVVGLSMTNK